MDSSKNRESTGTGTGNEEGAQDNIEVNALPLRERAIRALSQQTASEEADLVDEIVEWADGVIEDSKQMESASEKAMFLRGEEDRMRTQVETGEIGGGGWGLIEGELQLNRLKEERVRAERLSKYEDEPRTNPSPVEVVVKDVQVLSDGRGNNEDEEVRLPPREDLRCQSPQAREDIFDIYDVLNEDRKKTWPSGREIYRAVADRKKGNKPADVSQKSYMTTEMARLYKSMKRTLENRGLKRVRVLPKDDMANAKDDEQAAKWLRDWILELGDGCQPEWEAREPFS